MANRALPITAQRAIVFLTGTKKLAPVQQPETTHKNTPHPLTSSFLVQFFVLRRSFCSDAHPLELPMNPAKIKNKQKK